MVRSRIHTHIYGNKALIGFFSSIILARFQGIKVRNVIRIVIKRYRFTALFFYKVVIDRLQPWTKKKPDSNPNHMKIRIRILSVRKYNEIPSLLKPRGENLFSSSLNWISGFFPQHFKHGFFFVESFKCKLIQGLHDVVCIFLHFLKLFLPGGFWIKISLRA